MPSLLYNLYVLAISRSFLPSFPFGENINDKNINAKKEGLISFRRNRFESSEMFYDCRNSRVYEKTVLDINAGNKSGRKER